MSESRFATWYSIAMAFRHIEQKVGGFFTEFWKFAAKGNAIQLAVAVVIGGAFGAIINSLVADVITPLISFFTNSVDFSVLTWTIREEPALVIGYGKVIQASLNFLIVGLAIFGLFKMFQGVWHRFQTKEAEQPPAPPVSNEEKLLTEIRDILKERGGTNEAA
jgi:large conductance mechanosensitive channel